QASGLPLEQHLLNMFLQLHVPSHFLRSASTWHTNQDYAIKQQLWIEEELALPFDCLGTRSMNGVGELGTLRVRQMVM
ncbi:hypothetical protein IRJ41_025294, partial [Triplophysa rosa]